MCQNIRPFTHSCIFRLSFLITPQLPSSDHEAPLKLFMSGARDAQPDFRSATGVSYIPVSLLWSLRIASQQIILPSTTPLHPLPHPPPPSHTLNPALVFERAEVEQKSGTQFIKNINLPIITHNLRKLPNSSPSLRQDYSTKSLLAPMITSRIFPPFPPYTIPSLSPYPTPLHLQYHNPSSPPPGRIYQARFSHIPSGAAGFCRAA